MRRGSVGVGAAVAFGWRWRCKRGPGLVRAVRVRGASAEKMFGSREEWSWSTECPHELHAITTQTIIGFGPPICCTVSSRCTEMSLSRKGQVRKKFQHMWSGHPGEGGWLTDGAVGHQMIAHMLPDGDCSSSPTEVDALSVSSARVVSRRLAKSLTARFWTSDFCRWHVCILICGQFSPTRSDFDGTDNKVFAKQCSYTEPEFAFGDDMPLAEVQRVHLRQPHVWRPACCRRSLEHGREHPYTRRT